MKRPRPRALQQLVNSSPFESAVALAIVKVSANKTTQLEYRRDFDLWRRYCGEYGVDPQAPREGAVEAWLEWMRRKNHAPKSRARRMSALSSIYRELRRAKKVAANPFSADDGPQREKVSTQAPTQIAYPSTIRRVLEGCDESPIGIRDAAIIRVLWSTGMRRISLLSMTLERLQKDRDGWVATVTKKGQDEQRVLIRGKARQAFDRWLAVLKDGKMATGPIWRQRSGKAMTERQLNRMLAARAKSVGETLSPHMMRVSFLTYNPADLDAKQDAAGHADPATTRLYDRKSWRGREAFDQMPELEDVGD